MINSIRCNLLRLCCFEHVFLDMLRRGHPAVIDIDMCRWTRGLGREGTELAQVSCLFAWCQMCRHCSNQALARVLMMHSEATSPKYCGILAVSGIVEWETCETEHRGKTASIFRVSGDSLPKTPRVTCRGRRGAPHAVPLGLRVEARCTVVPAGAREIEAEKNYTWR